MLSMPLIAACATAGMIVDRWFGEPRRHHPLEAFGRLAKRLETHYNTGRRGRPVGLVAWLLAVVPPVAISWLLVEMLPVALACVVHVALLWFALGARSLREHIEPIAQALGRHDLDEAR